MYCKSALETTNMFQKSALTVIISMDDYQDCCLIEKPIIGKFSKIKENI